MKALTGAGEIKTAHYIYTLMGTDKATHLHINNYNTNKNSVMVPILDVIGTLDLDKKPGDLTIDKCIEYLIKNSDKIKDIQFGKLNNICNLWDNSAFKP